MRALFLLILLNYFTNQLTGQGCSISISIEGIKQDSIWFSEVQGRRLKKLFGAEKESDGFYRLQSNDDLPEGLYAIQFKDNRGHVRYLNCWLLDGQRSFSIQTDIDDIFGAATVGNSPENDLLLRYLDWYGDELMALTTITRTWKDLQDSVSYHRMVEKQEFFRQMQEEIMATDPSSRTAALIQETLFETPEKERFSHWQEEAVARHNWFRKHFFRNMDFSSGKFLRFPMWVERADYYYTVLPPPQPDSMIAMIEDVLRLLEKDRDALAYWFPTMIQTLEVIGLYRTDEVYLYFINNWIAAGKADFLSDDRINRFRRDAERMAPLVRGKTLPDLVFYDKDRNPVSVHDTEAAFTLLIFWKYNCGYCKKELPAIKDLYEASWKEKGLRVLAICGQSGEEEAPKCHNIAADLQLPTDWQIVSDYYKRTGFQGVYNVPSYPYVIVVDDKMRILTKMKGYVPEGYLVREMSEHLQK